MKTAFRVLLAIMLIITLGLSGCGQQSTPADIVKKQITSDEWYADMSEGTSACYRFTKDGGFSCTATIQAGEESAEFVREGTYTIVEENDAVLVILQYPNVNHQLPMTCTPEGEGYAFQIAGCDLYQK